MDPGGSMIKAIIAGNFLGLVVGFIGGIAAAVLWVAFTAATGGFPPHASGNQILTALVGSPGFGYTMLGVNLVAEISAGAVAGWIAKENMLVAGAFSSILAVLGALLHSWAMSYVTPGMGLPPPSSAAPLTMLIAGYGAPFWGIVGSLIAAIFSFRVAFRWLCVFPICLIVYVAIFVFGLYFNIRFMEIAAAALSIVVGVLVAPSEHRAPAFMMLVFITILIPVGVLAWQLAAHQGSQLGNIFWIFFNVAGVAFAYLWLRRLLRADSNFDESLAG